MRGPSRGAVLSGRQEEGDPVCWHHAKHSAMVQCSDKKPEEPHQDKGKCQASSEESDEDCQPPI